MCTQTNTEESVQNKFVANQSTNSPVNHQVIEPNLEALPNIVLGAVNLLLLVTSLGRPLSIVVACNLEIVDNHCVITMDVVIGHQVYNLTLKAGQP